MFRSLLAIIALATTTLTAVAADKDFLLLELKGGTVKIELLDEIAPNHVARVIELTESGAYDGIAFHRVIEGFMAQTGDVKYGKVEDDGSVSSYAGYGGSELPDLVQEFSTTPFDRGIVGAARGPDENSANSQFFIVLNKSHHLNKGYTVWGRVVEGMEHVDAIKRGHPETGAITGTPDKIMRAWTE